MLHLCDIVAALLLGLHGEEFEETARLVGFGDLHYNLITSSFNI